MKGFLFCITLILAITTGFIFSSALVAWYAVPLTITVCGLMGYGAAALGEELGK